MISVSVIVPSYKRVDQTIKTLRLLMASEGLEDKFKAEFIVPDSSPDDLLKRTLGKEFGSKIIYTRPKKPGISTNKNLGAMLAKGGILIFCDSDIEVNKDTIKKTVNALKSNKYIASVGGKVIWRGAGHDGEVDRPRVQDRLFKKENANYIENIYSRYIATYRKIFDEVGGYDEEIFNMRGEGADLSIRYWRAGYPLGFDPEIVVHHIFDAPDSIALRIEHPEWAIARDLLILGYKYGNFDDFSENFNSTLNHDFGGYKDQAFFLIFQGIEKNLKKIEAAKRIVDKNRIKIPNFNFKFLEVFSDQKLMEKCIEGAEKKLVDVRKSVGFD